MIGSFKQAALLIVFCREDFKYYTKQLLLSLRTRILLGSSKCTPSTAIQVCHSIQISSSFIHFHPHKHTHTHMRTCTNAFGMLAFERHTWVQVSSGICSRYSNTNNNCHNIANKPRTTVRRMRIKSVITTTNKQQINTSYAGACIHAKPNSGSIQKKY